jgi:hypothetical protein
LREQQLVRHIGHSAFAPGVIDTPPDAETLQVLLQEELKLVRLQRLVMVSDLLVQTGPEMSMFHNQTMCVHYAGVVPCVHHLQHVHIL